ncbi:hypothetical protein LINPERHAP1_LOCUS40727 [Linum perenne]
MNSRFLIIRPGRIILVFYAAGDCSFSFFVTGGEDLILPLYSTQLKANQS